MDIGNHSLGAGKILLKLGNDGTGARHALLNIGNDSLGGHDTATNVGNRHICVYRELGLLAERSAIGTWGHHRA